MPSKLRKTHELTEEKWGVFSESQYSRKSLLEWEKWFIFRGKECKIIRKGGRYRLHVKQQWTGEIYQTQE